MIASQYGPFASLVGYGGAIMAAGSAMYAMWGGKMKTWRPPSEDLPGAAQKIVLLICGVFMVVEWYFAEPSRTGWMIGAVTLMSLSCAGSFLAYNGLIQTYSFSKPNVVGNGKIETEKILGGRELRPEAETKRRERGIETQELLEGAAYKVDRLWDRPSLRWVKTRVLLLFMLTLVFGTSALTTASFLTQVILTERSPASVIHKDSAPGPK